MPRLPLPRLCARLVPLVLALATAPGARADSVPEVDLDRHEVPLAEIYFDTFDGGRLPLPETTPQVRRRLLDRIPPLDDPAYAPASAGDWLDPDDLVLGYVAADGQAYAFPHKILNYHEIVNDRLGGVPVLVSYCPLCRSGVVYDRRLDGRVLHFSNTSALYENDMVMVDRETGSYWWQVAGRAIVGSLSGARLRPLPSSTLSWQSWRRLHPETKLLSRRTGHRRPYARDPFAGLAARVTRGQTPFPVSEEALADGRLPAGARVLAVHAGDDLRAYPVGALDERVVQEEVGGEPVVVFFEERGASAFSARLEGRVLAFRAAEPGFRDEATGSLWDTAGRAVDGPLAGRRLRPLPSRSMFWFALVAAFPEVTVYEPRHRQ